MSTFYKQVENLNRAKATAAPDTEAGGTGANMDPLTATAGVPRKDESDSAPHFIDPELIGIDDGPDNAVDDDVGDDVEYGMHPDTPAARNQDDDSDVPWYYGWMPMFRTWPNEWWWAHKPWSYAHMLLDLILRANRKPKKKFFNGRLITIQRGQVPTAVTKMADRAGWERKKVRRFLRLMAQDGELKTENLGQDGKLITVCKYELYAEDWQRKGQKRDSKRPSDDPSDDPTDGTGTGQ